MAPVLNLLPTPNGTASAQLLDPDHFQALTDALSNILSLEITRETIAQLFDGIPTWSVLLESQGTRNTKGAPVRKHTVLCDGALESAEAFIAAFDPLAIQYDPSVSQCLSHVSYKYTNSLVAVASVSRCATQQRRLSTAPFRTCSEVYSLHSYKH